MEGRSGRDDDEQQQTLAAKPAPMTHVDLSRLHGATAALGARLASVQLLVSRLDLQPYLNQARSIPWSGLAMVVGSNLQRLVS